MEAEGMSTNEDYLDQLLEDALGMGKSESDNAEEENIEQVPGDEHLSGKDLKA